MVGKKSPFTSCLAGETGVYLTLPLSGKSGGHRGLTIPGAWLLSLTHCLGGGLEKSPLTERGQEINIKLALISEPIFEN